MPREIRVIALQRSGSHAISHWILCQAEERRFYLNNANINLQNRFQCFDTLRKQSAAFKLISFEDYKIDELKCYLNKVEKERPAREGDQIQNVLILRDAYNQLASKMANPKIGRRLPLDKWPEYWVGYARACLNPDGVFDQKTTVINYNEWLISLNYRKAVAEKLGLRFTDKGFEDKLNFTWGHSSFEQVNPNQGPLNRWKSVIDKEKYEQLLSFPKLHELTDQIFGDVKG